MARWSLFYCTILKKIYSFRKQSRGLGVHDVDIKNTYKKYCFARSLDCSQYIGHSSRYCAINTWTLNLHCKFNVKVGTLTFGLVRWRWNENSSGLELLIREDKWLGNATLREQYPCLYNIARHKRVTVVETFSTPFINISWRIDLIGNKLVEWNDLVPLVADTVLS
jgi:hypothetical protein